METLFAGQGQMVKLHSDTQQLTWHWRHLDGLQMVVDVQVPSVLHVYFSGPLLISQLLRDLGQLAVTAFSIGLSDSPMTHEFDQYPELDGAFWRDNVMPDKKYHFAHVSTMEPLTPGMYWLSVMGRARNGHHLGEAVRQYPEFSDYGYELDDWDERHQRGYRPNADGMVSLEQYWYDAFAYQGPQIQLAATLR